MVAWSNEGRDPRRRLKKRLQAQGTDFAHRSAASTSCARRPPTPLAAPRPPDRMFVWTSQPKTASVKLPDRFVGPQHVLCASLSLSVSWWVLSASASGSFRVVVRCRVHTGSFDTFDPIEGVPSHCNLAFPLLRRSLIDMASSPLPILDSTRVNSVNTLLVEFPEYPRACET